MTPILCVQVIDSSGDHVWIPMDEWRTNPNCVLLPVDSLREPIVKENCEHWRIEPTEKSKTSKQKYYQTSSRNYGKTYLTAAQIYEQMLKEQNEQRRKRENWKNEHGN